MKYERPEIEVLEFGKNISTGLDIVGASQNPDASGTGDNEW